MIGDGVLPSNEGRGYVLRRLLRRAARHGRLLGYKKPFLFEVCDVVINENLSAYPELMEKHEYIKKTIKAEEDSFAKTVEKGMELLGRAMREVKSGVIDGETVFKLHDTFGFPVDLTREILNENNLTFDETKFNELMQIQKDTARANQAFKGGWDDAQLTIDSEQLSIEFVGYSEVKLETKILEIAEKDGSVIIALEKTPFYAESGGQAGDRGEITAGESLIEVHDTKKTPSGLSVCYGVIKKGDFTKGQTVTAAVDFPLRDATMRNHTSAHLLQTALRRTLGEHVQQAGSLVDDKRCRFDFTHGQALTATEIEEVELLVNNLILNFGGFPVQVEEMPIDKAKKLGAIALFGEKYGNEVRVVNIGPGISVELCGGTHVKNTAEIGLFKIVSEASIASGVRRIEAVTGFDVLKLFDSKQNELHEASEKIKQLNSAHSKEIARLNAEIAKMQAQNSEIEEIGEKDGIKLLVMKLSGANGDALRQAGDKLKSEKSSFTAVLMGDNNFYCVCDKEAVSKGFNAGNIVREISAVTGGKGGGRPDSAMAGIGDVSKIDEALNKFKEI
jgi:alanyl-tRNA synthetase